MLTKKEIEELNYLEKLAVKALVELYCAEILSKISFSNEVKKEEATKKIKCKLECFFESLPKDDLSISVTNAYREELVQSLSSYNSVPQNPNEIIT